MPCDEAPRRVKVARLPRALFCALVVLVVGCKSGDDIDRRYGRSYGNATNGVRVFRDLIEGRGHEVRRVAKLDHRFVADADVLVYVPAEPGPLGFDAMFWFQDWLTSRSGRTLLYVGHDFATDVQLFEDLAEHLEEQGQHDLAFQADTRRKLALYELEEATPVADPDGAESLYPFARDEVLEPQGYRVPLDAGEATQAVAASGGEARLYLRHHPAPRRSEHAVEVDEPSEPTELELRLELLAYYVDEPVSAERVWLASEGRALVSIRSVPVGEFDESRAILVHNASFLLNYSLIEPAHRVLAGALLDEFEADRKVVFFEPGGGRSSSRWFGDQPPMAGPSPIQALLKPPMGWVFLHWLIAGLLMLLARSAYLGRRRSEPEDPAVPFASHIRAYGRLLERSRDREHADRLIEEYRNDTRAGR